MNETPPSLGTPSRLIGEEMVLRAIVDVLADALPGAKQRVLDRAHARLTATGPKARDEAEFFEHAHRAIDAIMQVMRVDTAGPNCAVSPSRASAATLVDRRASSDMETASAA